MAETLADAFLHATELHRKIGQKKAAIQRAESLLGVATDAVIEARGQTSRAQSIAEQCIGAALQADAQRDEMAATAAVLQQKGQFLEHEARKEIDAANGRANHLGAILGQVTLERDKLIGELNNFKAERAAQDL